MNNELDEAGAVTPDASLPFLSRSIGGVGSCLFFAGIFVALAAAAMSARPYSSLRLAENALPIGLGLVFFLLGGALIFRDLFVKPRTGEDRGFSLSPPEFCFMGLIFMVGVAVVVPNLIEAPKSGNETAITGALKTIGTAQALFRESDMELDGNLDYGTLRELAAAGTTGLIDSVLGSGTKQGYLFACTYGASTSEFIWYATASPQLPGRSGDRYFATNHEGVTFYTVQQAFRLNSIDCTLPAGVQPVGR